MSMFRAPPREVLAWLEQNRVEHVILRYGPRVLDTRVKDVDLLVDDQAITALKAAFQSRRSGTKIDCYGIEGLHGSDYHGFSHLPEPLGRQILARRRQIAGVWVPHPLDELNGLLYHMAYHKSLQSGVHVSDPTRSLSTPGTERLAVLREECGATVACTLEDFHRHLESCGLAVSEQRLVAYIEHDFRHGRKSLFHALLQDRHPGELNLFMIRGVAVRHGKSESLIERLRERYSIVSIKAIDWLTRLTRTGSMRGGKWRRGGRPHIAVVVFDPAPVPATPDERKVHPFVFNRNQFIKVEWRDWFCRETTARAKDNPIHSTDNEAEALGHLPLFFSPEEREQIRRSLTSLRAGVSR